MNTLQPHQYYSVLNLAEIANQTWSQRDKTEVFLHRVWIAVKINNSHDGHQSSTKGKWHHILNAELILHFVAKESNRK